MTNLSTNSDKLGWYVVNDNVMGGRSDGDFVRESGQLRFAGTTLDFANITGMGLMIYDGNDGPFELVLDAVRVYTSDDPD